MPCGSFRVRKNGLIELRFRYKDETISVYGRSKKECIERKIMKIWELSGEHVPWGNGNKTVVDVVLYLQEHTENTVYVCCLRYCENARQKKQASENSYVSLVASARFIGHNWIGYEQISDLTDEMIEDFRESVSGYSRYTVGRAVCLLKKIMRGAK